MSFNHPFKHQTKLQIERYLNPDFRAVITQKFKALSLNADVEALQNARYLTLAARDFFGGSSVMNEVRPLNDKDSNAINSALRACFLALKSWAKLLPALSGSPDEFEARLIMAELYSKCSKLLFYGFVHDAKWHSTTEFSDLSDDDRKNAFEWLARRHSCHERAIHHLLIARGCEYQNGLQMLSDQPLDARTMWAYENAHNSARDLLHYGKGLLDEKAKDAIMEQNISYKKEMHKYEHR
jgi:hypothetical protein